MKLQRLAGFGPIAAFVSAAALLSFALINQLSAAAPPSLYTAVAIAFLTAACVWVVSLAIVVFDLEYLEHPATSTRWVRAGLVAAIVAVVMSLVLPVAQFTAAGQPYSVELAWAVLLMSFGFTMVVHNVQARRARLLRGALPWIGIVDGSFWIYLGILQFIFMFTPKLVMGFVYGLPITELLYLVWAIWLGVHLVRSKAKSPARATAAA